jgi:ATP-binding cassette subfamily C (CFTR/MRP) protein 1
MEFSTCANDETFGPSVQGCRGDFDFTLKFEKIILSILPSAIFIALSVPRVIIIVRKPKIVGGAILQFT